MSKTRKTLRTVPSRRVALFKIANRRGYAALCMRNLTEGATPFQAYMRLQKALRRQGCVLKEISASQAQGLVK